MLTLSTLLRAVYFGRSPTRPFVLAVALAWAAWLGTGPCKAAEPGDTPKRGGTLIIGQDEGPERIDPHGSTMALQHRIIVTGPYESLLSIDQDYKISPSLAAEWVQESPTSYLFTLRDNVKFHDGSPFTADDVVFTFERILDPKRPSDSGGKMRAISQVTAVDSRTVRFTLSAPTAPFVRYMASPDVTGIVSRKFTTEHGNDLSNAENGTGPFKITRYQPGVIIAMERFADYWQPGLPYLDGVEIRIIPDDSTRIAALRTGEIDMSYFRPDKAPLIATLKGLTVSKPTSNSVEPLVINCESAPLDKLQVRQALALAIDKTALMRTALPGGLAKPTMTISSGDTQYGYQGDGSDLPYAKRDIAKAKELLAEAGYPNGVTVAITYINTPAFAVNSRIAQIIKEQVAPAGINVSIRPIEYSAYPPTLASGNFQIWSSAAPMEIDPDGSFTYAMNSTPRNHCKDPEADGYLARERAETDPAKRAAIFDSLERRLMQDVRFIYLYSNPIRIEVWKPEVKGYVPLPTLRRTSLRETWLSR